MACLRRNGSGHGINPGIGGAGQIQDVIGHRRPSSDRASPIRFQRATERWLAYGPASCRRLRKGPLGCRLAFEPISKRYFVAIIVTTTPVQSALPKNEPR